MLLCSCCASLRLLRIYNHRLYPFHTWPDRETSITGQRIRWCSLMFVLCSVVVWQARFKLHDIRYVRQKLLCPECARCSPVSDPGDLWWRCPCDSAFIICWCLGPILNTCHTWPEGTNGVRWCSSMGSNPGRVSSGLCICSAPNCSSAWSLQCCPWYCAL